MPRGHKGGTSAPEHAPPSLPGPSYAVNLYEKLHTPPTAVTTGAKPGPGWVRRDRYNAISGLLQEQFPNKSAEDVAVMSGNMFKQHLADDLIVKADGIKNIFQFLSTPSVEQLPDTIAYAAISRGDQVLAQNVSGGHDTLSAIYGEGTASVLETFLIDNDIKRAKSQDLLQQILEVGTGVNGMVNPLSASGDSPGDMTANLLRAADPVAAFEALAPVDRMATYRFIEEQLIEAEKAVEGAIGRSLKIVKTNDYSIAFSPDDIKMLTRVLTEGKQWSESNPGRTNDLEDLQFETQVRVAQAGHKNVEEAALNRLLGIDQYRAINDGVLVIDEEWAKTHPDDVQAAQAFLEERFPDVTIQIGRNGVVLGFMDKLGRLSDAAGSRVSAAARQASEAVEGWNFALPGMGGSGLPFDFEDRTEQNQALLDQLLADRAAGKFKGEALIEANSDIFNLREDLTDSFGADDFDSSVDEAMSAETPGFGVGAVYAQSLGLGPGDNGYNAAMVTSGIASQMIFDITNLIFPFVKALRSTGTLVKYATTVDQLPTVAKLIEAATDARTVDVAAHATVLAKQAKIPGLGGKITRFAERIGGYVAPTDESIAKIAEYTHAWMAEEVARSGYLTPQIGGILTQKIFKRIVSSADEMAVTPAFRRNWRFAADTLEATRNNPGEFASIMEPVFGRDKSALMAKAAGETAELRAADLQDIMIRWMTGRDVHYGASFYTDSLMLERYANTQRIRKGTIAERRTAELEAQLDQIDLRPETLRDYVTDTPEELDLMRLEDELKVQMDIRDEWRAVSYDVRARQAHIKDILAPQDWDVPKILATRRELKTLKNLRQTHDDWDKLKLDALTGGTEMTPARVALYNRRLFKNEGFNHELVFGLDGNVEGSLAHSSIAKVKAWMRFMGLKEGQVDEILKPWVSKELDGNLQAQFEYFEDLWTKTWEQSNMPATAIDKFRYHYKSRDGVRSAANINEGTTGTMPARYDKAYVDPATGMPLPGKTLSGKPIISAQEIKAYRMKLPSMQDMFDLKGFTKRHLSDQAWLTKNAPPVASLLRASGVAYEGVTEVFKTAILVPRLVGSLPLRILTEQHLRIAGYGHFFNFRHPIESFGSMSIVNRMSNTEIRLFAESPTHLLGTVVDDFVKHGKVQRFTNNLTQENDGFVAGVNVALEEYIQSPEFKLWIKDNIDDPDAWLAAMRDGTRTPLHAKLADQNLAGWAKDGWTAEEAVERTRQSLLGLIGEGEGADLIRAALANGGKAVSPKTGAVISLGGDAFTEVLTDLKDAGKWIPGVREIPNSGYQYLPRPLIGSLEKMRDFMFRNGYSRPDLALSRSPLFRRLAVGEYRNALRAGYSPEAALAMAKSHAATETAEIMFEIGAHTTGEHFLKILNPFFPATREMWQTWALNVPKRMGGTSDLSLTTVKGLLGWGLGATRIARRIDVLHDAGLQSNILLRNKEGDLTISLAFIPVMLNTVLGTEFSEHPSFKLNSLFGLFPMPMDLFKEDATLADRVMGAVPTLGAPAMLVRSGVSEVLDFASLPGGEALYAFDDYIAPYGADPTWAPKNVELLMSAAGLGDFIFWQTAGQKSTREAMHTSAIGDGLRVYMHDHWPPPPKLPGGWETKSPSALRIYENTVVKPYAAEAVKFAETYANREYFARALATTFSPVTIEWTDEGSEEMQTMWDLLQPFKGLAMSDDVSRSVISTFIADNPTLEPWLTGKYLDTRDSTYRGDDWDVTLEAIEAGTLKVRSPSDIAALVIGKNTLSILYRRRETLELATAKGKNAVWTSLMDQDYKAKLADINSQIDHYRDVQADTESMLPGQTMPFTDMLEQEADFRDARSGKEDPHDSLTYHEQSLLEFDKARKYFDKLVTLDPESSKQYFKTISNLYDKLDALYPEGDPVAETISYFYKEVGDPYWSQVTKLYAQLDDSEPSDDALIYNQIRNLANQSNEHVTYKGFELPSPEEYSFAQDTDRGRRMKVADWAALPAEYLTEFQREQVGYSLTDAQQAKASSLANFAFRVDRATNEYARRNGASVSDDDQAKADAAIAGRAMELGLSKYWLETKKPEYVRIGKALDLGARTDDWNTVSRWATQIRSTMTAAGESFSSELSAAPIHDSFIRAVENLHSEELNVIFAELRQALGHDGNDLAPEQLIKTLFFDVWYN